MHYIFYVHSQGTPLKQHACIAVMIMPVLLSTARQRKAHAVAFIIKKNVKAVTAAPNIWDTYQGKKIPRTCLPWICACILSETERQTSREGTPSSPVCCLKHVTVDGFEKLAAALALKQSRGAAPGCWPVGCVNVSARQELWL
jgi:hypothetical protein